MLVFHRLLALKRLQVAAAAREEKQALQAGWLRLSSFHNYHGQ
jgi:hypothetical protein